MNDDQPDEVTVRFAPSAIFAGHAYPPSNISAETGRVTHPPWSIRCGGEPSFSSPQRLPVTGRTSHTSTQRGSASTPTDEVL